MVKGGNRYYMRGSCMLHVTTERMQERLQASPRLADLWEGHCDPPEIASRRLTWHFAGLKEGEHCVLRPCVLVP